MGSINNAILTGFICRLCSKSEHNVIHIYGEKGRRMKLLHIIKTSLSVNVHYRDRLPKTVCQNCADKIVRQYEFIRSVQMKAKLYRDYKNKKLSIYELLNNRETLSRGS